MNARQSRFFAVTQPALTLEWNSDRSCHNKTFWDEIKRLFIAANIMAYCLLDDVKTAGIDNDMENAAINKWRTSKHCMETEILPSLKRYFARDSMPTDIEACLTLKRSPSDPEFERVIVKLIMLEMYFSHVFDYEQEIIRKHAANDSCKVHYLTAYYHEHPIAFTICQLNYKTAHIYVRWAVIAPGFQRAGLGEKLFQAVERHFPDAKGIDLYARDVNDGALRFYDKNHFIKPLLPIHFDEPTHRHEIPDFIRTCVKSPAEKFHLPADDAADPDHCVGYMRPFRASY